MFTVKMQRALEADGEKLRQLTGEDHGPHFPEIRFIACEECQGEGWIYHAVSPSRMNTDAERDSGECPICKGAGVVEIEVFSLDQTVRP